MAAFSRLGEQGLIWLATCGAGALVDPERRLVYRRAARSIVGAYALNQAVKAFVRCRRPELPGLPPLAGTLSGLSYPSAHAATSFAGARMLSASLPAPVLYSAATSLALSRLYLGLHYPSDVVAGAALGAAVAELLT